jgi:hypothetical protein
LNKQFAEAETMGATQIMGKEMLHHGGVKEQAGT